MVIPIFFSLILSVFSMNAGDKPHDCNCPGTKQTVIEHLTNKFVIMDSKDPRLEVLKKSARMDYESSLMTCGGLFMGCSAMAYEALTKTIESNILYMGAGLGVLATGVFLLSAKNAYLAKSDLNLLSEDNVDCEKATQIGQKYLNDALRKTSITISDPANTPLACPNLSVSITAGSLENLKHWPLNNNAILHKWEFEKAIEDEAALREILLSAKTIKIKHKKVANTIKSHE